MPATIGVISDTHGWLRREALAAFEGANLIIHAGDIGKHEVLDALSAIAPLIAIRGNIDTQPWALQLPATQTVQVEQAKIYVVHNLADLDFTPENRGYAAVISGHSHQARSELHNGVLYLNPGSAGPRRFRLPVTLAILSVDGATLRAEIRALID
jgi:putative phosphoesterase